MIWNCAWRFAAPKLFVAEPAMNRGKPAAISMVVYRQSYTQPCIFIVFNNKDAFGAPPEHAVIPRDGGLFYRPIRCGLSTA